MQQMNLPAFDKNDLLDRVMDDEELAGKVVEAFLQDIPQQLTALAGMVAAGDVNHAGAQAHRIRGASASVGGLAMSAIAEQMETEARGANLRAIQNLLPGLNMQFQNFKAAIAIELRF